MKNLTELRNDLRVYADQRKEQSSAWRRLAEAAMVRSRLCEDAGRDAHELTKINDDYSQVLEQELEKIESRYLKKVAMAAPLVLVDDDNAVAVQSLKDWFNNHTNYSGPGPTSPPGRLEGEAVCRAR